MSQVKITKATGSTILAAAASYIETVNITKAGDATTALDIYDSNVATFPTAAAAATATAVAGAGVAAGAYKYQVTFVSTLGENLRGTEASVTTSGGNLQVNLTAIPTGPAGTTSRKIYRTLAAGATNSEVLLATINDNTTTTYSDNAPDASITGGPASPSANVITATNLFSLAGITAGGFPQANGSPDSGPIAAWGLAQILTASTSPVVQVIYRSR